MGVGGVGLVVGVCVHAGLVLVLRGSIALGGWSWVLARCLVVGQGVCLVASLVLFAVGLSGRFREWVVSGVRRCGQWERRLFRLPHERKGLLLLCCMVSGWGLARVSRRGAG